MRTLRGWRSFWAGLSGCWRGSSCSGSISAGPAGTACLRTSASSARPVRSRGAVEQFLGDEMHDLFRAALNVAFDQHQPRAHHLLAEALHHLRPHHDVGDAGFVLQRHEDDALGAARTLPHQHHAGAADALPVAGMADRCAGDARLRLRTSAAGIPSDGPSATAGWSDSRPPPAPAAASRARLAHARPAARARRHLRTAAAARRRAAAAPPTGRRGDRARWSETHRHPPAGSARAWASRCRGQNPPAR